MKTHALILFKKQGVYHILHPILPLDPKVSYRYFSLEDWVILFSQYIRWKTRPSCILMNLHGGIPLVVLYASEDVSSYGSYEHIPSILKASHLSSDLRKSLLKLMQGLLETHKDQCLVVVENKKEGKT